MKLAHFVLGNMGMWTGLNWLTLTSYRGTCRLNWLTVNSYWATGECGLDWTGSLLLRILSEGAAMFSWRCSQKINSQTDTWLSCLKISVRIALRLPGCSLRVDLIQLHVLAVIFNIFPYLRRLRKTIAEGTDTFNCLSVYSHGKTRLTHDGFSWKLILGIFTRFRGHI